MTREPTHTIDLRNVLEAWSDCLHARRKLGNATYPNDMSIASRMVGLANTDRLNDLIASHPAAELIFELAASLELPDRFTSKREERWACIEALLNVLQSALAVAGVDSRGRQAR